MQVVRQTCQLPSSDAAPVNFAYTCSYGNRVPCASRLCREYTASPWWNVCIFCCCCCTFAVNNERNAFHYDVIFISEMTYTVSSGTLDPSIPYYTILHVAKKVGRVSRSCDTWRGKQRCPTGSEIFLTSLSRACYLPLTRTHVRRCAAWFVTRFWLPRLAESSLQCWLNLFSLR